MLLKRNLGMRKKSGEDQQRRRKPGRLEKSRSTRAPVLGGEEEQPPAVRRDVRLYGEEAQAEGRAQEKQRMAANSRKASKTAAGTVAYDDGSAGLGTLRRLEQVYQLLRDAHSRNGIISYTYAQPASPLRGRRQILRLLVAGTSYSVRSTPAFVYASTAQAITTTQHCPSTTRNRQGRRDFVDGGCNCSTELERSGIAPARWVGTPSTTRYHRRRRRRSGEGSGAWYRRGTHFKRHLASGRRDEETLRGEEQWVLPAFQERREERRHGDQE
ncbi:hypothetical protein WOLCODRAFT_147777 [Wolfiporia cocos MD-104 SS10]|uniref:Uncharacterized protein n=1 Tax=Wolfiporia cocos (strain MD-104) TaxID=742152 RepID=A0A2H3IUP2_WOLCO|nr:hypothetical protein WOLCODRAFT_147777 [Wolfiporia cocos MD-104 SS10]